MKKFLKVLFRFSLPVLVPLLILLAGYFVFDPFKVLYDYQGYSNPYVVPNRDFISTKMFTKNLPIYHYNSFIFGSSRTIGFKPASWKKHLKANDSPFMFDASAESVYGIYCKLKYLEHIHCKIDNALIILCHDCSFKTAGNEKGHLFIHDPVTTGESWITFHLTFLKAYFSKDFLTRFYTYKFTGKYKEWMKGYIENRKMVYDPVTNETNILDQEYAITHSPNEYYSQRREMFYIRDSIEKIDSVPHIDNRQAFMLSEINRILNENHAKFKVVISPLYEEVKLNGKDLQALHSIFQDHLYDFSGKNIFTENKYNYYETAHFRPSVGDSILNIIYGPAGSTIAHK